MECSGGDSCGGSGADEIESESVETIERILCAHYKRRLSVERMLCTAGSSRGDNYMSVVKRLQIIGKWLDNQSAYSSRLIVKRQIASKSRRQLFRCDEAFLNEIAAYCHVVPAFQQIATTSDWLPLADCLYAGTDEMGDVVVLQDLTVAGFEMVDRLKGLDFEHCVVVMKALGCFHAISFAMSSMAPDVMSTVQRHIQEIVYCPEASEFYTHSLECSLREALFSLRASNTDGALDYPIRLLATLSGRLYKIMSEQIVGQDDRWKVICHGDLWINNLMFRRTSSGRTDSVRLIDLQAMRYSSPVTDLLKFLYTSTERSLRDGHLDDLIVVYRDSVITAVRAYIARVESPSSAATLRTLEQEFTVDRIKMEIESKIIYALGISMWLLPAVTFHPDRIPDLDAVKLTDFTSCEQERAMTQIQTPEYHSRIRDIVLECHEKGFLEQLITA